jgi:hypothetical protein
LRLRIVPGAAGDRIVGRHGDAWKVRVAAPPERGKANAALVRLLARTLGVAPRDVSVVSGAGARDKIVTVAGLDSAEIDSRMALADRKESR